MIYSSLIPALPTYQQSLICAQRRLSLAAIWNTLREDSKAQHLKSINKTNIHILCLSYNIAHPRIFLIQSQKLKPKKGKVQSIINLKHVLALLGDYQGTTGIRVSNVCVCVCVLILHTQIKHLCE